MLQDKLKRLVRGLGVEVKRPQLGVDYFHDIEVITGKKDPVIFDVGANEGQSALRFCEYFPRARVTSFEPSAATFAVLEKEVKSRPNITPVHLALGEENRTALFNLTAQSVMNSLLDYEDPEHPHWRKGQEEVEIQTLDRYAEEHQVEHIDLLKIDTQGYDLQVIKGARRMLEERRIHLVKAEVLFVSLYKDQAFFHDIYAYMLELDYRLTGLYALDHEDSHHLHWGDAMFVRPESSAAEL